MPNTFVEESKVYKLLASAGLDVPPFGIVESDQGVTPPFEASDKVVVKALAEELWHKSDLGGVKLGRYEEVQEIAATMRAKIEPSHQWLGALVVECVDWRKAPGLPDEGFVSLRWDGGAGWVCTLGVGGIHTELWAKLLGSGVIQWPLATTTPAQALEDLKAHLLGRVWLGQVRQGEALLEEEALKAWLEGLWRLPETLKSEEIHLLEMNPVVVSPAGRVIAIDGVGQRGEIPASVEEDEANLVPLFAPKRVGVAGVSARAGNVGRIITENILASKLALEDVVILKPKVDELFGVRCVPDVSAFKEKPLDLLVVALPAPATLALVEGLIAQGGGAEIVYLVAGGIGDGADKEGWGGKLTGLLHQARADGKWTPRLVGPNGLGLVNASLKLSTLFIPEDKLQVSFDEESNLAFVSQSGAFLITRISNDPGLALRYGFCIGNQIDVRFSDFLQSLRADPEVAVAGLYVEGFQEGDALACAKEIGRWGEASKRVVIYKGGRTEAGMAAAAGHTGAMAADYDLQRALLLNAGAHIAETFTAFSSALSWLEAYPKLRATKVTVVTNAGYESVASQDNLVAPLEVATLDPQAEEKLTQAIASKRLSGLVSAHLPLDVTPMANEDAYCSFLDPIAETDAGLILLGLVPLTKMLVTDQEEGMARFAASLAEWAKAKLPLGVIVDSGPLYDPYRAAFRAAGLPCFESIEDAVEGLICVMS